MVLGKKLRWLGTGLCCPIDEKHGTMWWVPKNTGERVGGGYYFCSHSDHSPVHGVRVSTRNLWSDEEIERLREEEDRAKTAVPQLP